MTVTPVNVHSYKFLLIIVVSFFFLIFSFFMASSFGSVEVSSSEIFNSLFICPNQLSGCDINPITYQIIWEIRLPRILMALLTGSGLAITGAILQSVTRNPLADPYLFGISAGASLGAVLVMAVISTTTLSISMGALIGGAFSVFLMLLLAGRCLANVEHLVLSGVAVSFMLSAFTSLVLYYSSAQTAASLLFWMMGSFSNSQWQDLSLPAMVIFLGSSTFFVYHHYLEAIQSGDESALTLGIAVNKIRILMLIISAAITGVLVAEVGGIGFVGLMIDLSNLFFCGI